MMRLLISVEELPLEVTLKFKNGSTTYTIGSPSQSNAPSQTDGHRMTLHAIAMEVANSVQYVPKALRFVNGS